MTPRPSGRQATPAEDPRWAAVLKRDATADAQFVYAVKTTGVYCRPSARSRMPRRENVEFFDSAAAAEEAGYRPSRHAAADRTAAAEHHVSLVAQACRLIEADDTPHSLDQIASSLNISAFHFHRLFKVATGLTPKAYASATRACKLRAELSGPGASVTKAIYSAGFNSNSRFYAASDQLLGMRASDYRAGGHNVLIRCAVGHCLLGAILVAQGQRGICAITLGEDPAVLVRELHEQFAHAQWTGSDPEFEQLVAHVVGLLEAPALGLNLPIDIRRMAFQERVWQALRLHAPGPAVRYMQTANGIAVAIPSQRTVPRTAGTQGYR